MKMEVKINSLQQHGAVRAYGSLNIEGVFAVTGIKIMEGSRGLFVSMPSYKTQNGEYKDICFPLNKDLRDHINQLMIGAYQQKMAEQQNQYQPQTQQNQYHQPTQQKQYQQNNSYKQQNQPNQYQQQQPQQTNQQGNQQQSNQQTANQGGTNQSQSTPNDPEPEPSEMDYEYLNDQQQYTPFQSY